MKGIFSAFLLLCSAAAFAESASFKQGEELYVFNKPAEAKPYLEKAISEDPTNELAYLHLGIVYIQLNDLKKAISVLKRGLTVSSVYRDQFYNDIGMCLHAQKENTLAEQSFTDAITENPEYATPYLGRAKSRMRQEKFDGAASDFITFLQLIPDHPERPAIEEILRLLGEKKEALAKAKAEEEARQKALMSSVLDSLKNASEETKNVSVESLQFKKTTEDVDIED